MTGHDLRELQDLMIRAYVRHFMFLATLPYYLIQEMGRVQAAAGDRRTGAAAPILLSDWRARPKAGNE
jgi:hypothetical protein